VIVLVEVALVDLVVAVEVGVIGLEEEEVLAVEDSVGGGKVDE
jgi:hypothetical protein